LTKNPHLLLLRFSALGDVAITIPVIRCLYKTYPNLIITFVSRVEFIDLFEEFENFNFHPVYFKGKHNGIIGLCNLFFELKGKRFSGVADLHGVIRTYFLSLLFKLFFYKVSKIRKGRKEKHLLTRGKNKKFQPLTPTFFRYADVFRNLGFPISMEGNNFPKKRRIPKKLLSLFNESSKKWIGIAPFASHPGKSYPLDLMQKVIAYLQKEHKLFLFGSVGNESNKLSIWESAYKDVINTSEKFSFREQLDLISNLDLMISMDSANGHLAANSGTKVLTLWGLTHPFCGFTPFNQPLDNSITLDRIKYPLVPTSIYGKLIPKGYQTAFRSTHPKKVIEKALELLWEKD